MEFSDQKINYAKRSSLGIGSTKDPGYQILYKRQRKMRVLMHYGGLHPQCVCCGVDIPEFLELDHIVGGTGLSHRDSHNRNIWGWIIRNNFPPGFQVLCIICNSSKRSGTECIYHKYVPKPGNKIDK